MAGVPLRGHHQRDIHKLTTSEADLDKSRQTQLCETCAALALSLASSTGLPWTVPIDRRRSLAAPDDSLARISASWRCNETTESEDMDLSDGAVETEQEAVLDTAEMVGEGGSSVGEDSSADGTGHLDAVETSERLEETTSSTPGPTYKILSGGGPRPEKSLEFDHFGNWSQLTESAASGCELCVLILQELRLHYEYGVTRSTWGGDFHEDWLQDGALQISWSLYDGVCSDLFVTFTSNHEREWMGGPHKKKVTLDCSLELFAEQDVEVRSSINGRRIFNHAALTFPLLKHWLSTCLSSHDNCESSVKHPGPLPTRVLDVQAFQDSRDVRLVLGNGSHDTYLALSHCWGDPKKILQTKTTTLPERLTRISFEALPKSFQDAVTVARALKVRYIWIDSLCIIQDSDADWAFEASRMSEVYKGSLVTIGSACAEGSTGGFLSSRPHLLSCELSPFFDRVSVRGSRDCARPSIPSSPGQVLFSRSYRHVPDYAPLDSRAWCLQESILPTRMASFTAPQLYWSCNTLQAAEGEQWTILPFNAFTAEIRLYEIQHSLHPVNAMRIWIRTIEELSTRKLTKGRDKLICLSGIAREFQDVFPNPSYVAGLWSHDFHRSLVWEGTQASEQVRPYRAPSWSWAACDGRLRWDQTSSLVTRLKNEFNPDLVVNSWHVDLDVATNSFGQVTGGYLDIGAVCISAEYVVNRDLTNFSWHWLVDGWDRQSVYSSNFDHYRRAAYSAKFTLVRVAAWAKDAWDRDDNRYDVPYVGYLIVEPCGEDTYQRVGMLWSEKLESVESQPEGEWMTMRII